jgi:hypothetical protein
MAEKEHLNILSQGPDVWNDWREAEFYVAPDLSGQDLRGAEIGKCYLAEANLRRVNMSEEDLSNAQLNEADLSEANLNGANLSNARLTRANLFLATLVGTNLYGADLQAADFRDANLTNSNLSETYLGGTTFTGADLSHTNLIGATINATTFGDNDLSVVEGLNAVKHGAASIIGVQTLYRSKGRIPEDFLRGCGVPENLITYVPSLFGDALESYSCFISYSSKDEEVVDSIYRDLQTAGVRCWRAPQNLKVGENITSTIYDAIRLSDKLLLVLSSNSVESEWVHTEVRKALEKERAIGKSVLFPVRLDDSVLTSNYEWAITLRTSRHIGDFRHWQERSNYQRAISRLIRDLKLSIAIESEKSGAER